MEKLEKSRKQEKQTTAIRKGGGIGVVLLGGVAAIAALVSVSATKSRKTPAKNDRLHPPPPPATDVSNQLELSSDNDDQGRGVYFLPQDSERVRHPSGDGTEEIAATQVDSTEDQLDEEVTKAIADDKVIDFETDNADQITEQEAPQNQLIGDGRHEEDDEEERNERENNIEDGEEVIEIARTDHLADEVDLQVNEIKKDQENAATDVYQSEAEHNPQSQFIDEGKKHGGGGDTREKGEEAVETVEADPQVELNEEHNNNVEVDKDGEEIVDIGEETSKGTGTEAIWPAGSMEESTIEVKELKIYSQQSEEKMDEFGTFGTDVWNGNINASGPRAKKVSGN